jgi:hypothetical protein
MLFLTTTHPKRSAMQHAVISRAMGFAAGNEFVIQHYGDIDEMPLRAFAEYTGNLIQFNRQPNDRSVCHTKRAFTPIASHARWLNFDDDIFLNKEAYTNHAGHTDCLSTGVVDRTNGRGYAAWTLESFTQDTFPYDDSLAGYFRFADQRTLPGLKTQLYSLPMSSLGDAIWKPVEDVYHQHGVRGYDIALFNSYRTAASAYRLSHITGMESMHLGTENTFLNEDWKAHVQAPVV